MSTGLPHIPVVLIGLERCLISNSNSWVRSSVIESIVSSLRPLIGTLDVLLFFFFHLFWHVNDRVSCGFDTALMGSWRFRCRSCPSSFGNWLTYDLSRNRKHSLFTCPFLWQWLHRGLVWRGYSPHSSCAELFCRSTKTDSLRRALTWLGDAPDAGWPTGRPFR